MKQLIIMFLCAFLFACTSANKGRIGNEQDITIIDLSDVKYSEEPSKLSEFVESISYIRLDDTPLIPDLLFTGIAVIDDAIYIDQKFVYKYTLDGKFLMSLFKQGQGPGEANKVATRAAYDLENKMVAVNNNMGLTFRLYSLEGEHIGDVSKADSIAFWRSPLGCHTGGSFPAGCSAFFLRRSSAVQSRFYAKAFPCWLLAAP